MKNNVSRIVLVIAIAAVAATVSNCRIKTEDSDSETASSTAVTASQTTIDLANSVTAEAGNGASATMAEGTVAAVDDNATVEEIASTPIDADKIPYPVYPNSSPYRVGDENGLTVVLFETVDSFTEVDAFYQAQTADMEAMPRLSAMEDYVRFSGDVGDTDPWETARPGVVIHQFNSASEREAVGASDTATTNIIMSFE